MNRRILAQVAAPIVLTGLLLFGACAIGAWQIDRLESNMGKLLKENVASLRAAQDIEIHLRRLRFDCALYLMAPADDVDTRITQDRVKIKALLQDARQSDRTGQQQDKIDDIDTAFEDYIDLFNRLKKRAPFTDHHELLKAHPVQQVIDACETLVRANEAQMEKTQQEADAVSHRVRLILYLIGLGGPLGGIIVGFGVARGLSRSIYQLSVRVQNVAQRLDQDVASIRLAADGDIAQMDSQLQHILTRVEEVAQRLQRQQRDMLRAEQLSAVGQLAASVAHEIRNPISGIKLLVEAALRARNPMTLTAEDLRVIHEEVARVEQTVQGLLDFARLPSPRLASCDVRQLISQAVNLVGTRARQQRVEIRVDAPDQPVLAQVDAGQLSTVLVNILLNALDALPTGGQVDAQTDFVDGEVRITVTDSGPGIPPDMLDKLFVPFASSKATGTGLGLSICRRIIEEHGGRIDAENMATGGARFTVTLPKGGDCLPANGVTAQHANHPCN